MSKSKKLAVKMAVNEHDLNCLINSVYNEMLKDGLSEHFCLVATENERREIIMAYVEHAVKKISSFGIAYMTNDGKRNTFHRSVKGLIDESK